MPPTRRAAHVEAAIHRAAQPKTAPAGTRVLAAHVQAALRPRLPGQGAGVQPKAQPLPQPGLRARGVVQRSLPVGTYVTVYDDRAPWYGRITAVDAGNKRYSVRMGGTEREVPVAFHQAGLHSAFAFRGQVPQGFETPPLEIDKNVWCYHVTSASNLRSIIDRNGLRPRASRGGGGFAGLDDARGAKEVESVPKRLSDLFEVIENPKNQEYEAIFKRQIHDTMLGAKDDFVNATRQPLRIFEYAATIRDSGQKEILVLRFHAGSRAWYRDQEDDSAEKSLSSIPLSQLEAAKFERTDVDVSPKEAAEYLGSIRWYSLNDQGDQLDLRFLFL